MIPQWVLPLRRPDNHQLRTAMVTANWRGCGAGRRRLDGEAIGGRRLARTAQRVARWLAASTIAPPTPAFAASTAHGRVSDRKIGRRGVQMFRAARSSADNRWIITILQ
jgi:hypothetical protein